jgi:PAS domain S-box-containing protein
MAECNQALATSPDGQLFYDAFRASPIGIVLEDLTGRLLFVNPAFCAMLGFTEDELRKKHCVDFSPAEDAEKDWALFQQLQAGSIDHYHLEKRYYRRDGSLIWGRLSISLLNSGASQIVVAMVEDITEKKAAQEELLQSQEMLHKLAGQLMRAQEEERARIARELHDDINQRLATLALNLNQLEGDSRLAATTFSRNITETRKQLEELGNDLQALSHSLRSAKLQYLGLAAAAANLCTDFSDRLKLKIDFTAENIPHNLPEEIALCLFRVLQEALRNAIKHSAARQMHVSLTGEEDAIHLMVRDYGIGFDLEKAMKGTGIGLVSMKERLKLVDGDLSIESQSQRGTTVHALVPLGAKTS